MSEEVPALGWAVELENVGDGVPAGISGSESASGTSRWRRSIRASVIRTQPRADAKSDRGDKSGTLVGMFQLNYPKAEQDRYRPVQVEMSRSFQPTLRRP
jgi:hypothetical protein